MSAHEEVMLEFARDRVLAHRVLFHHRHPLPSPPFHEEMVKDWHSEAPYVLDMVFRGGAKSTIAEEAVVLMAGFREFRNCLVIGANHDRAMERLHAIARELEDNADFIELFGDLRGSTWTDEELILNNGRRILAMGRGQSLRGIKFEESRPDLVFIDDLEDRADVRSEEARKKVDDWFWLDLLPACSPERKVRMAATPLHPQSLAMNLKHNPEWITHTFPIYHIADTGDRVSSWPQAWPMDVVDALEANYAARGNLSGFRQEYMCEPESALAKTFSPTHIRIRPRERTWEAVYAMIDPARTVKATSAMTGWAVWSWVGSKMIVWEADGDFLKPDEIIRLLFRINEQYSPVKIGIEEDGLNEWLMQPIRHEQVKRSETIPVAAMRAPKGKESFIEALQPFFNAEEIELVENMPKLKTQLLAFPTGKIDVPNALAYALKMRPGAPIYDDFSTRHVTEGLRPSHGSPLYLALNASHNLVTGVLAQIDNGCIRIYADWVREGEPNLIVKDVIQAAQIEAARTIRCTAGPVHFDRYNNVGLTQACRRIPVDLRTSAVPQKGRETIRNLLQRERMGLPMLQVSNEARWALNAFSGGYSRALLKQGQLADYAEDGQYRVLMEGIESFAGLLDVTQAQEDTDDHYATTADGRKYLAMRRG